MEVEIRIGIKSRYQEASNSFKFKSHWIIFILYSVTLYKAITTQTHGKGLIAQTTDPLLR